MSMIAGIPHILPDWPAPDNIVALVTTRGEPVAGDPYSAFNLAQHVGDHTASVSARRDRLIAACDGLQRIQWLEQVHGTAVAEVTAEAPGNIPQADAATTRFTGVACAVMTADCLPLLICDRHGQQVAAVHAGWRGLLHGVIETTVAKFRVPTEQLLVWLGPAIGPEHYEVGEELRDAFLADSRLPPSASATAFRVGERRDGRQHYYADLYQLARMRLAAQSVTAVYGGDFCTSAEAGRFYSFRRDGTTGRMTSLIYRL